MNKLGIAVLFTLTIALFLPDRASAGGMFLFDHGARALGRGGAFVAGADDGQALWYNPAGLAYTGRKHFLGDWVLPFFRANFQRNTRDDVNGDPPKVSLDAMKLPLPSGALVDSLGIRNWSFGVGAFTPSAVIMRWPQTAGTFPDGTARPGSTRYSLVSMQGSLMGNIAFGAAYSGIKGLSIGAGVHVILSRIRGAAVMSGCDYGALCQQAESPDWDINSTFSLPFAITATPTFGLIYGQKKFRIGASFMLFHNIQGTAKIGAAPPTAPIFGPADECTSNEARKSNPACAYIEGDKAKLVLKMPMIARAGIELRPSRDVRMEAAVVYEGWSRQDAVTLTPKNIRLENALGIPAYDVGPITIPRAMKDVWSLRLGMEATEGPITVRGGIMLEKSAFPTRTMQAFTLDSDKMMLSFGGSLEVFRDVFLDFVYAHIFMRNVTVTDSEIYPINAFRPPLAASPNDPVGRPEPISNGAWAMEADLIGGGLRVKL